MITIFTKRIFLLVSIAALLTAAYSETVRANHEIEKEDHAHSPIIADPEHAFSPSEDIMRDIDNVLDQARSENKLALLVMGANWCHDSRGLAQHFTNADVASIVTDNYVPLFVDVGYLDFGKDVISRFGMPVIYGTPTVLIIDPTTEKVVNRDNMHQWRDAASIPLTEVKTYFDSMSHQSQWSSDIDVTSNPAIVPALAAIDAFEMTQSERIYKAFAVIGPMLKLPSTERPRHFMAYWNQLRDLRYSITEDLDELRKNAVAQAMNGADEIRLEFPNYPPFDWE